VPQKLSPPSLSSDPPTFSLQHSFWSLFPLRPPVNSVTIFCKSLLLTYCRFSGAFPPKISSMGFRVYRCFSMTMIIAPVVSPGPSSNVHTQSRRDFALHDEPGPQKLHPLPLTGIFSSLLVSFSCLEVRAWGCGGFGVESSSPPFWI